MKRLYIYIIALFALCGCMGEDESYNTLLVVRPYHQVTSDDDYVWLEGCVAYAFEGVEDIDLWGFESYDDALNGVMTELESGLQVNAIAKGVDYAFPTEIDPTLLPEYYDDDYDEDEDYREYEYGTGALSMQIKASSIVVLVVDPSTESYGYRTLDIGVNLATTYVSIPFRDWKYGSFTQGYWTMQSPDEPTDDTDTTLE
ncbi:MAG: hypothetical protein SNH01_01910 [Rikenellaceae bacterium]